jgi:hypothetical protein
VLRAGCGYAGAGDGVEIARLFKSSELH